MTRIEKCIKAKELGYVYNPKTGVVYGLKGQPLTSTNNGYIEISGSKSCRLRLLAHTFGYWWVHGRTPSYVDHIDLNKKNNRITNLREVTNQENSFNTNAKGYSWDKTTKKWRARITVNGKPICLGRYNTQREAIDAYLLGKKKYHKINNKVYF